MTVVAYLLIHIQIPITLYKAIPKKIFRLKFNLKIKLIF